MKIIVNADDFGIDIDRDFGIFYGVLKGYISSISVVTTNKIGIIRKILVSIMKKRASIGIHINLTDNPLIKYKMEEFCKNFYDYDKKKFVFWKNAIENTIYIEKIKDEIGLQINKFVKKFKMIPNHIDGHNQCNIFSKDIENIFERFSNKYNAHLRIPYEELDNFNMELLQKNSYFKDYKKITNLKKERQNIKKNMNYFFKYDMYLNNYMCMINCPKDINFVGTMYGYFREPEILRKQLTKFNKDDIIQIMTHPGFYWKKINHKTPFSNKNRVEELDSLKILKDMLNIEGVEYINYKNLS